MAAESLLGGLADSISADTINLLDQYLADTVEDSTELTELGDGSVLLVGTGANGETQGAVVAGNIAVATQINAGVMELAIQLPPGVNIAFEGLSELATPEEIEAFVASQIDDALPLDSTDPSALALNISLKNALSNITNALINQGIGESVLTIVSFSGDSGSDAVGKHILGSLAAEVSNTTGETIVFDATDAASNEVFALLLGDIQQNDILQLQGVENAMLVGSGTVQVGDDNDVNLQGDNRDQHVTGGGGNDTLVGGGGNDTLIGGSGDDVIGFNALGNYTIEIGGADKLAFQFDGINTLDDLLPFVTGVSEADGNVTYEFLDGEATITLVGMTADEVTADMVIFNL
ncbi:hypothetical protein [Nitrosomonas sp. Nm166]|uniref:hypothetical protein n=1 Tax=Nitrosomonas sp. Nm166 TaxID=1881054 RepID=UPI0008E3D35A|nr:hypothetical protein [Nitrosomonas sp. Nm166]SFE46940.1 hypothetical protein SAMN05428977_101729 [Nitrosomonas sp. Nm166]